MGIPLYFKIISEKYPNIIKDKLDSNINNLFLDLNCAIHPCCRKILEEYSVNNFNQTIVESKMINEVLNYIQKLVQMVNPKLLYIAIDGVAPCAKMNQQRLRRYKTVYEKSKIDKIKEEENKDINTFNWNTNAISPGTEFMDKLSHKIKNEIKTNKLYENIKVYFSDSYTPGEGEHKILDYIKKNDLDGNIVIYGLDADLIILSFVAHKSNIYLLREAVQFGKTIMNSFLYLDIDELKFYIIKDIQEKILCADPTLLFDMDKLNNLLDDYIFISFLVGNDFLPHLLAFDLRNDGLTFLLEKYVELYVIYEQNLVNSKKKTINWNYVKTYFNELKNYESDLLLKMSKKRKKFRFNRQHDNEYDKKVDLLNNYPILNQDCEKYIDIGTKNWKYRFYNKALNVYDEDDLKHCCLNYITGLKWTYEYYFKGCRCWKWKYNYRHCPSIMDILSVMKDTHLNDIKFKDSKPYSPIVQLLSIFPKTSSNLVPIQYRKLMSSKSEIGDYYPDNYSIDTYYKRYFWQCEPILPLIDYERLNKTFKKIKMDPNLKKKLNSEIFIK
jgi:5'-3' exonuclease